MPKFLLICFSLVASLSNADTFKIKLPGSVQDPSAMPFISSSNFLSLNIIYEPVLELRTSIKEFLQLENDLKFSTVIFPQGEAHVTIITPPDFAILSQHLSMSEIETIALSEGVQSSDLHILGLGSAKKVLENETRETFFLIVESLKLRKIRLLVYDKFVEKGGDPGAWDPAWFFPHITIGFTHTDLHEPDVLKNIKYSLDKRFEVAVDENQTIHSKTGIGNRRIKFIE